MNVPAAGPVDLSVVIVSWNCREFLAACLRSVLESETAFTREVLVIDNASEDGTAEFLGAEYPWVTLVMNPANLGFAPASNIGIRLSRGRYVLLLNPDAQLVRPDTLDTLVRFMEGWPQAGAVGCRLVYPSGEHQVGDAGYRPCLATVLAHSLLLSHLFPNRFRGLFLSRVDRLSRSAVPVEWVCGGCMLVRRSVVERVGPLSEEYFMYGEDLEWGCRMSAAGFQVWYLRDLTVVHSQGGTQRGGVSTRWLDSLSRLYLALNGRRAWAFYKGAMCLGFALRLLAYSALSLSPRRRARATAMRAYLRHMVATSAERLGAAPP